MFDHILHLTEFNNKLKHQNTFILNICLSICKIDLPKDDNKNYNKIFFLYIFYECEKFSKGSWVFFEEVGQNLGESEET